MKSERMKKMTRRMRFDDSASVKAATPPLPQQAATASVLYRKAHLLVQLFELDNGELSRVNALMGKWDLSVKEFSPLSIGLRRHMLGRGHSAAVVEKFIENIRPVGKPLPGISSTTNPVVRPLSPNATQKIVIRGKSSTALFYKELVEEAKKASKTTGGNEIRVLVAEADQTMRAALRTCIKDAGLSVTAVEDGTELLQEMDRSSYSVVIFDLKIPGIHGLELLERLAKRRWRIPVVLYTAHKEMSTFPQVSTYGPLRICQKQQDAKKVVEKIRQLVSSAA